MMPIYKSYNGQEISYELGNYFCDLLYKKSKDKKNPYKVQIYKHPNQLKEVYWPG